MMIDRTKRFGRWEKTIYTGMAVASIIAAGVTIAFFPKWGIYNRWDKEKAVQKVEERYAENFDSLRTATGTLEVELARRDTSLKEKDGAYRRSLDSLDVERKREEDRLKRTYQKRLEEARKASLDSLMARYPGFNPNLDYFADDGNFGGRVRTGAKDIEDYFALESRLDIILRGVEDAGEIKDRILSGKTTLKVMTEKEASRYNPVVVMDPGYWGFEFESGRAVGLGRKLNNYPLEGLSK